MKAVVYLTLYAVSMYFDYPGLAFVAFLFLFKTIFLQRIVRARHWWVRVPLASLMFPITLVDYLFTCARYAPTSLITARPYALTWTIYLAVLDGNFVPAQKQPKD